MYSGPPIRTTSASSPDFVSSFHQSAKPTFRMMAARVTTLPAEILSLIIGEFYNASEWEDLRALRLTCQRLSELITPILFSDVHVNLCGSKIFKASSQLEDFSLRRTRVTQFVKSLNILSLEQQFDDMGIQALRASLNASRHIGSAIRSLRSVDHVSLHVCQYNPKNSTGVVLDALTYLPKLTSLTLSGDTATNWCDINFHGFMNIVEFTIEAPTGEYLEHHLHTFMTNNPRLQRLCVTFQPPHLRIGWRLDVAYIFDKKKGPFALEHLELHGRWRISDPSCIGQLPSLASLCLSDDDDEGSSLALLLSHLVSPLKKLVFPLPAAKQRRLGKSDHILMAHLSSYSGLEELTVSALGVASQTELFREALPCHIDTLTKVVLNYAFWDISPCDYDFLAVSQFHNLQHLEVTLLSIILTASEVVVPTVVAWLDIATRLYKLRNLHLHVIDMPATLLPHTDEPTMSVEEIIQVYSNFDKTYPPHLRVHVHAWERMSITYHIIGARFMPLYTFRHNVKTHEFPCETDGRRKLFRIWAAGMPSTFIRYWFEAYPVGLLLFILGLTLALVIAFATYWMGSSRAFERPCQAVGIPLEELLQSVEDNIIIMMSALSEEFPHGLRSS
ncbi:uncharacterized protein EV420DRAFT_1642553 [Desarmillaria tabescens]|uniref:F-box domain-containing protein n=1 Tax=Armillaria tabescens TaxID=1929756 RepID=A0AA39KHA2_ARMTA|nr:uncharacterized protein EV420DRAFT_1642553 [Desarmillaria tabescens]KAK0458833.1 hypothetical protein EV420DRAFT_1642553 [Desarmillaria tabescens]